MDVDTAIDMAKAEEFFDKEPMSDLFGDIRERVIQIDGLTRSTENENDDTKVVAAFNTIGFELNKLNSNLKELADVSRSINESAKCAWRECTQLAGKVTNLSGNPKRCKSSSRDTMQMRLKLQSLLEGSVVKCLAVMKKIGLDTRDNDDEQQVNGALDGGEDASDSESSMDDNRKMAAAMCQSDDNAGPAERLGIISVVTRDGNSTEEEGVRCDANKYCVFPIGKDAYDGAICTQCQSAWIHVMCRGLCLDKDNKHLICVDCTMSNTKSYYPERESTRITLTREFAKRAPGKVPAGVAMLTMDMRHKSVIADYNLKVYEMAETSHNSAQNDEENTTLDRMYMSRINMLQRDICRAVKQKNSAGDRMVLRNKSPVSAKRKLDASTPDTALTPKRQDILNKGEMRVLAVFKPHKFLPFTLVQARCAKADKDSQGDKSGCKTSPFIMDVIPCSPFIPIDTCQYTAEKKMYLA